MSVIFPVLVNKRLKVPTTLRQIKKIFFNMCKIKYSIEGEGYFRTGL